MHAAGEDIGAPNRRGPPSNDNLLNRQLHLAGDKENQAAQPTQRTLAMAMTADGGTKGTLSLPAAGTPDDMQRFTSGALSSPSRYAKAFSVEAALS